MGDSKFQKSERALVTLLKKKKEEEEKLGQLRYFIVTILVDYHNQPFIIFIDTRARSLSSFVECRTENTEWKRKFFVASTKKSSGDPRWPSIPRLILLEYAVDRARDAASILDATLSLSLSFVEETGLRSFITPRCSFVGDNRSQPRDSDGSLSGKLASTNLWSGKLGHVAGTGKLADYASYT